MSSIPRQPHHHAPPTSSRRNAPPNIDLPTASSPHICPWRRYWLHNHHLALPGNHPCLPIIPQPTSGTLSASTRQPRLTPSRLPNSPTSAPMAQYRLPHHHYTGLSVSGYYQDPPLSTQPSANIGHPITIHPSAPQYPLPLTQQADLGYPIRVSLLPGHRPSSVGPYYGGVICLG